MANTLRRTSLDGDGVLLDYNTAYARLWERVFNETLTLTRPDGYHAIHRYGIPFLDREKLAYFNSFKDDNFWSNIPALPGALEACILLKEAGHHLTCVTAIQSKHLQAREFNLRALGFPIDAVIATGTAELEGVSPKARALAELSPERHVDDYYAYFKGIPSNIRRTLIHRDHHRSPNLAPEASSYIDEQFGSLLEFTKTITETDCNFM